MNAAILYPVFAQIALTLALLMMMGWVRRKSLLAREVRFADIALDGSKWPDRPRQFSNCYSNQFELPIVFYVLCLAALATANADQIMVLLAWAFVASRCVHAYIHTTSNYLPWRGLAFLAGFIIVAVMMIVLIGRMIAADF